MTEVCRIKEILQGFDIEAKGVREAHPQQDILLFAEFRKEMANQGHYEDSVVFLLKTIGQMESFNKYFNKQGDFLFLDISTLGGYIDWLQEMIWMLDGLQILLKCNSAARDIAKAQEMVSYFYTNIFLLFGSIKKFLEASLWDEAVNTYIIVTEQIDVFHSGSLIEFKEILEKIID